MWPVKVFFNNRFNSELSFNIDGMPPFFYSEFLNLMKHDEVKHNEVKIVLKYAYRTDSTVKILYIKQVIL